MVLSSAGDVHTGPRGGSERRSAEPGERAGPGRVPARHQLPRRTQDSHHQGRRRLRRRFGRRRGLRRAAATQSVAKEGPQRAAAGVSREVVAARGSQRRKRQRDQQHSR